MSIGPQVGLAATIPLPSRGSPTLNKEDKISSGPIVGLVATYALPSRGSPKIHKGDKIRR